MSQRAPAVHTGPPFIEAFLAQTRLAPRTRAATRPDPDLSTSVVPSAGPAPAVTDTLQVRHIASLATCIHSGSPGWDEPADQDVAGSARAVRATIPAKMRASSAGQLSMGWWVGVQGNGRGLRECGYPFCHVCGEDRAVRLVQAKLTAPGSPLRVSSLRCC